MATVWTQSLDGWYFESNVCCVSFVWKQGRSILHWGAGIDADVVRVLVESGANIDAADSNVRVELPRCFALAGVDADEGEILYLMCVDMLWLGGSGTVCRQGATALHGAATNGNADVVRVLLELGANVNATTSSVRVECVRMLRSRRGSCQLASTIHDHRVDGVA